MSGKRTTTVGVLLITYRDNPTEQQPIRWVRLGDFTTLASALKSGDQQEARATSIREQLSQLKAQGVTPAKLAAAGIDIDLFRRLSTTRQPWPILSYNIKTLLGAPYLRVARTHELQLHLMSNVSLVQRRDGVEDL